jgi:hypothetical protein
MKRWLHMLRAESTTVALNWLPTLAVCAAVTAWVVASGSVLRPMQPRVLVLSGGPAPACSESGYHQAMRGAVACPGDSLDSKSPRSHLFADGVFAAGRSWPGGSACGSHGMALAAFVGAPSGQIVPPAPPQIPPLAGPRVEPLSPPSPIVPPVAAPPAQHKSPSQTGGEGSSPARQHKQSPAPHEEPPSVPPGGTVQLSP